MTIKITRHDDWRARLSAYINDAMRKPFRPGKHDCALFAAGAIEAMTGVDFARGFRGYRTLAEGQRRLSAKGFDSIVDLAADRLTSIPVAMARAGDVAIVAGEGGQPALGVVQGGGIHVLHVNGGLGLVDLLQAKAVLKV